MSFCIMIKYRSFEKRKTKQQVVCSTRCTSNKLTKRQVGRRRSVMHRVKIYAHRIVRSYFQQTKVPRPNLYRRYYNCPQQLYQIGFRKWYIHRNDFRQYKSQYSYVSRACCHELVYINTNFLKKPEQFMQGVIIDNTSDTIYLMD